MSEVLTAEEIQHSQKVAEANFVRVVQSLPESMCAREDSLQREFECLEENPVEKLGRLYDVMDQLYDCVDAHTLCKPGCIACCHYTESVTEIEVLLIEQKTPPTRRVCSPEAILLTKTKLAGAPFVAKCCMTQQTGQRNLRVTR